MDTILEMLPLLVPVFMIDLILAVTALLHVHKHPYYRFGNKAMWTVIVLCLQMIGPAVYFLFGKGEER